MGYLYVYMKLFDIISEIGEELYKWDLEGAKKIIEKYKSINDFRTDYPKIYDAIRSRKLIPDLLDHLETLFKKFIYFFIISLITIISFFWYIDFYFLFNSKSILTLIA